MNKKKSKQAKSILVNLDGGDAARLQSLCEAREISATGVIREAIQLYHYIFKERISGRQLQLTRVVPKHDGRDTVGLAFIPLETIAAEGGAKNAQTQTDASPDAHACAIRSVRR